MHPWQQQQLSLPLRSLSPPSPPLRSLCELNVTRPVLSVCTSPVVQAAWAAGQQLAVYGVIYNLKDGLLRKLVGPVCRWAARPAPEEPLLCAAARPAPSGFPRAGRPALTRPWHHRPPTAARRDEQLLSHDEDQFMNQTASFVVGDKAMALTDSGAKVTPPGEC
jgi:hypothetical protein